MLVGSTLFSLPLHFIPVLIKNIPGSSSTLGLPLLLLGSFFALHDLILRQADALCDVRGPRLDGLPAAIHLARPGPSPTSTFFSLTLNLIFILFRLM